MQVSIQTWSISDTCPAISEPYPDITYREVPLVPPVVLGFPEAAAVTSEVLPVQLQLLLLLASLGLN